MSFLISIFLFGAISTKLCPLPPHYPNSYWITDCSIVNEGQFCVLGCATGFRYIKDGKITCHNQKFTAFQGCAITPAPVNSCPTPPTSFGWFQNGCRNKMVSEQCTKRCIKGYGIILSSNKFVQRLIVTCSITKGKVHRFDNNAVCAKIPLCPKTAIPNGKYSSNCGTTVGQTCIALCNEKFLPPSTTLKCEFKNRQSHFNPQTVTCKKVQCPGMTKPSIGVDLKKCATPTNVDDKCNWGCKAKFKPHKTTSTIAICQFAKKTNTGTWSVVPKCDPVFETCGLPQDKSIDVSRCQQKIADDECVAICPDGRIVRTKCTKTSNAKPVFSPPIVCSRKKDETERNLVYGLSGAAIGIVILILIVVTVICCRRKHASEEIEEQSESSDENTKRSNSDSLSTKSPLER